jgi:hypothetical protein
MTRPAVAFDLLQSGAGFQINLLRVRKSRSCGQRCEDGPNDDEWTNDLLPQFAFNVMFCMTLLW